MERKVYLAGQSNEHDNNWKLEFTKLSGFVFYDWEIDSDQTSPQTFFPDDLNGVASSSYLVANPGVAPSEATWIEIGYFLAKNTNSPGEKCNNLIIIWKDERSPKWSIEFVKQAGHVVNTIPEAVEKLLEISKQQRKFRR